MKPSICGVNCTECPWKETCPGCTETNGCPFGNQCFIAKYILTSGMENYQVFKRSLVDEINALHINGMETVTDLYPLVGSFVNLEYPVPGGTVRLLKDDELYLGTQVKNLFDDGEKTFFGVIALESFILICTYGENGVSPEIVLYKKR